MRQFITKSRTKPFRYHGFHFTITNQSDGIQRKIWVTFGEEPVGTITTNRHTNEVSAKMVDGETHKVIARTQENRNAKERAIRDLRDWIMERYTNPRGAVMEA